MSLQAASFLSNQSLLKGTCKNTKADGILYGKLSCFDPPTKSIILAASPQRQQQQRAYLSDRRVWYHQLKPKVFAITVFRIVAIQFGQVTSNYYVDMLEDTMKLDQRVEDESDPMTRQQADMLEKVWAQSEWEKRFDVKAIMERCKTLVMNAHLISMTMRCLEGVVVYSCTPRVADEYIIDTFSEAKRKFEKDYDPKLNQKDGKTKAEIGREMATICLKANAIAYVADYIVFQCKLTYTTFYCYRDQKSDDKMRIFMNSSAKLALSRFVGLLASCTGSMIGTILFPPGGYGTLIGGNFGDSIAGAMMEGN